MVLCECWCGKEVNPGRRFVHGHNRKGKGKSNPELESEQRLCKCGCGQEIIIQSHHKYYGIPDYINHHQHNRKEDRDKESKRQKQYQINHPEIGKNHSEWMLQFHNDNPDVSENQGKQVIQYYIDHPEARKELAKKKSQYYKDHPELIEYLSKIGIDQFSTQESRERMSAIQKGQNYDAGEWTGFTDKNRPHIIPVKHSIQLNERFEGSHGHHITPSIVIFIPSELHNHIKHNLQTGYNMGKMNMLALQFINGGL